MLWTLVVYRRVISQRPLHSRPIRWRRRGCPWTGWQRHRGQSSGRGSALWRWRHWQRLDRVLLHQTLCLQQGRIFRSFYHDFRRLLKHSFQAKFCQVFYLPSFTLPAWMAPQLVKLIGTQSHTSDCDFQNLACMTKMPSEVCAVLLFYYEGEAFVLPVFRWRSLSSLTSRCPGDGKRI